jgi:hypothetical protein
MTNLDLIILANKFKIPIILYSSTKLIENNQQLFIINNNIYNLSQFDENIDELKFFFIKSPGVKTDMFNEYKLLYSTNDKNSKISLSNTDIKLQNYIKKNINFNLKSFIEQFNIDSFTPTVKLI